MTSAGDGSISHLDLLARTQELQAAAIRDDHDAFRAEFRPARADLAHHLHDERAGLTHLPPITQRVVTRGQQRLLDLVEKLHTAAGGEDSACPGLARSVELTRELTRQARLEAALLRDSDSPQRR